MCFEFNSLHSFLLWLFTQSECRACSVWWQFHCVCECDVRKSKWQEDTDLKWWKAWVVLWFLSDTDEPKFQWGTKKKVRWLACSQLKYRMKQLRMCLSKKVSSVLCIPRFSGHYQGLDFIFSSFRQSHASTVPLPSLTGVPLGMRPDLSNGVLWRRPPREGTGIGVEEQWMFHISPIRMTSRTGYRAMECLSPIWKVRLSEMMIRNCPSFRDPLTNLIALDCHQVAFVSSFISIIPTFSSGIRSLDVPFTILITPHQFP